MRGGCFSVRAARPHRPSYGTRLAVTEFSPVLPFSGVKTKEGREVRREQRRHIAKFQATKRAIPTAGALLLTILRAGAAEYRKARIRRTVPFAKGEDQFHAMPVDYEKATHRHRWPGRAWTFQVAWNGRWCRPAPAERDERPSNQWDPPQIEVPDD